jgi:hypothetical protein
MTRSIFDPAGGETERSGSTFTAPDADQISHLPEEFTNPPTDGTAAIVDFQPPPEKPAIEVLPENDGKLLVVRMSGKLHKSDYAHFVPVVEQAVLKHGKVRMLVELHNFHGWDAGGLWEDFKFDVKHFNHIERLAIVGDKTWEKWMATFCKPFTTASIRYFPSEQVAQARKWVSAPLEE